MNSPKAIAALVLAGIDRVNSFDLTSFRRSLSVEWYVEQYRTITVKLSRKAGHTTAAYWLMKSFGSRATLVVRTFMRNDDARRELGREAHVVNGYMLYHHSFRGFDKDIVIVDDASSYGQTEMKNLFRSAYPLDPIFVLLG